jgi:hypothetical protein
MGKRKPLAVEIVWSQLLLCGGEWKTRKAIYEELLAEGYGQKYVDWYVFCLSNHQPKGKTMQQEVANTQKALDKPCNICGKAVHNGWHYGVHSPTQGLTWRQTDDTPYSHVLIKHCEECKQKQVDYFQQKEGMSNMNTQEAQAEGPFSQFKLVRKTDITGISGTGVIALGVQWPDQSCHLFWPKYGTHGWYPSIGVLRSIHCYPDASGQPNATVEWVHEV